MMRAFDYVTPKTQPQAVSLLGKAWGETEIIAGGTDLLALMKDDVVTPKRLVNIKQLPGMHAVSNTRDGMSLGALTLRRDRVQTLCGLETISRKVSAAIRGIEEFRQHVMIKVV